MQGSIFIALLQNIAVLLAFSMVYENFWIKNEDSKSLLAKGLTGLIIGGIGILLIYTRWIYIPGIGFDTRSVLLSVTGLFFGGIPTMIAIAITAGMRIYIGGGGVLMGVAVIVSSGLIGLLWRYLRPQWKEKNYALELLAMGFLVHVAMLSSTLLLPSENFLPTVKVIAIPLLFLYSPATMLLGVLMLGQWNNYQNRKAKEELREAEHRLNKELVLAKEKAEESDRLKSSFLANLSHEIRTPMNAILGFTDLLIDPNLSMERRERYNTIIQNSGNHLISIIDDIIEISKIETNQVKPHISKVNIPNLLKEVYQLMYVNAQKNPNVEFRLPVIPENAVQYFQTDELKLKQILINLVGNAIKFTETGYVEFGYEVGAQLTFFIRDTGCGINPAHHDIIFERFRQVGGDISIIKGGSGLGLAIVKAYVEMLGGKITVESEPEKGSLFKFTLP